MNSELKIFENAEFGSIRTVEVDGTPYFVGKDVAEIYDLMKKHGYYPLIEAEA